MYHNNALAIAKNNLAERVGVLVKNLEFSFIWKHAGDIYFSFQINDPGHAQNGSTLSINVSDFNRKS